ncbi:hypothetical protein [Leuconostoc citreum]|uniref:hypothetical protein n=1 Tax=Leuconostoc citreum TaxID=33964 RepID=UPI0005A2359F|nr:hypothetical protein [Leuconostoc citreum]
MFYEYIKANPQWNLQINRQLEEIKESPKVKKDLAYAIPQLEKTKAWDKTWYDLAIMREKTKISQLLVLILDLLSFISVPTTKINHC